MIRSLVQLPRNLISSFCRTSAAMSTHSNLDFLDQYDPQQVSLLYEPLMVVDRQDRIIGETTKKDAHLLVNIESEPTLIHRAFSFFLFDSSTSPSRLILQQRAPSKITYPTLWANTCCSHPLYNNIEMHGLEGVKHAVIRRVKYELGYEENLDLIYVTRIFYQARNIPDDGIFGESEIDYIILAKHPKGARVDLAADFQMNQNEVQEIRPVTLTECDEFVRNGLTTPWFTKIVREGLLAQWWTALDKGEITKDGEEADQIIQL